MKAQNEHVDGTVLLDKILFRVEVEVENGDEPPEAGPELVLAGDNNDLEEVANNIDEKGECPTVARG